MKKNKRYLVTLYYCTHVDIEVEARNEKEALSKAYGEADDEKYNDDIINSLEEINDPDIEELP